jgi:hypothetical protein
MSNFLAKQESVLPLDYKLQVVFVDGKPETIPMGTTGQAGYLGGLAYREKIAQELRILMMNAYGLDSHDLRTLCFDLDGNEVVVIRSRSKPKNNWSEQLQERQKAALQLGRSDDIIDI